MDDIIYEDGKGNLADENGNRLYEFQMEVDQEMHPISSVTDYDAFLELKPPEKEMEMI